MKKKMVVRHIVGVLAGVLIFAPAALSAANTIVPGYGVGRVHLGEELGAVTRTLGQPRTGDAAMGRTWWTWGGIENTPAELDVYTSIYVDYPDGRPNVNNHALVEQVRVTSSWFRTSTGVGIGSSLAQVRRRFPRIKLVGQAAPDRPPSNFYDDQGTGIAFAFGQGADMHTAGRCIAVVVHRKDKSVLSEYASNKFYIPR